jgi:hypothetical protein
VSRYNSPPACDEDPLWYDCRSLPCESCPYRMCRDCGLMQQDCDCDEANP